MSGLPSTPSPFDLQPPPSAIKAPWWSTWEDVLDVYYSPGEVFARRRDGRYLASLLVVCLLSALITLLSAQLMEAVADVEFSKAMAKAAAEGQKMTPEQLASVKEFSAKFLAFAPAFAVVLIAVSVWVGGLVLWLLTLMLGGKIKYGQSCMVVLLASVPELIERAIAGAQSLMLDTTTVAHKYSFSISAARFLPADTSTWLMKVAALADPFVIWGAALVGIGVYVLASIEKEKAAVVAVLYTLIFAVLFR